MGSVLSFDSLRNFVSGLGTAKDKTTGSAYTLRIVDAAELNAMHRSDWLSRKVVDIIPNDMTREWRDWQAEGDAIEKIEALEKSPLVNLAAKVNQALQTARLFGGSVIYIGIKGDNPEEPLEIERIRLGDLAFLRVLSCTEITAAEVVEDVTSELFGEPAYYEGRGANGSNVKVHPSRMVRFTGAPVLDRRAAGAQVWGDPVLQVVYDALQNAGSAQQHVAALIPEAKVDVIYIPNLSEYTKTSQGREKLTSRFTYANMAKSMVNALLLEGEGGPTGKGERWEQKTISFAQLPELIRQFLQIAAGAADIPVTRLLGESPSGLNATGKSDLQNYYDNIAARQRTELSPALHVLDEVIIRSATGKRDPEIYYEWAPLWGLSEKEKADIFSTKATAARTLAGTGGASPSLLPIEALSDALVNALVEDGSLPGLEAAIEEYGKLSEQEEDPALEAAALGGQAGGNVVPLRQAANDARPRPLYVSRKLLNGADLIAWAKGEGIQTTLPKDDLHVTITFSREAVDWMKMGDNWSSDRDGSLTVEAGGARLVEPLGDEGAVVLLFASSTLSWRHESMVQAGASWDYEEYQPHVTITYESGDVDLAKVEPYRGRLVFGPEIFEELDAGGSKGDRPF